MHTYQVLVLSFMQCKFPREFLNGRERLLGSSSHRYVLFSSTVSDESSVFVSHLFPLPFLCSSFFIVRLCFSLSHVLPFQPSLLRYTPFTLHSTFDSQPSPSPVSPRHCSPVLPASLESLDFFHRFPLMPPLEIERRGERGEKFLPFNLHGTSDGKTRSYYEKGKGKFRLPASLEGNQMSSLAFHCLPFLMLSSKALLLSSIFLSSSSSRLVSLLA